MKTLICTAAAAWLLAAPAWAHDDHSHSHPGAPTAEKTAAPANLKLDSHTREDIERHRAMAQAHAQAAQCLEQGGKYDDCQKQLQSSCKGLALGKNCGMRHSH